MMSLPTATTVYRARLEWEHLLADKKDVHSAQIEFVKVGKCSIAIVGRMHACVKLHDHQ